MKRGDILFIRGNSFISKIINRVDGIYSHVAIALSEDTILEAQRFTESRIVKNYHTDYDIVDLHLTECHIDKLIDAALYFIGHDYDYTQIATILFNNLFKVARMNNRNKFICSELVIEVLYRIKYFTDSDIESIIHFTPNELYQFLTNIKG